MTVLFGAVQGVAAIKAEALSVHHAKTQKYHLKSGSLYLHQSGQHLQIGRQYAWTGTVEQARAARRAFDAAVGTTLVGVE